MEGSPDEMAEEFFREAYNHQVSGRLDEAIELYRKSISIHPTAEAHTFLGWTYSFKGEYEEAIDECKRAIEIDPDFGNPYNDIGAYLIRLGRFHEAIPWLQQACAARRYDARHYPFYNLGRVYERIGEVRKAIVEYQNAADLDPDYKSALQAVERLQAWMN
jgi:tetratricopeptide (TPR) repeat protein